MINTVIFDLDGTLLNSLGDLHACFNYAITQYGYPARTLDEIKSFVGNGIKKAIERALPYKVEDDELNKIVSLFKEYYQAHMNELTFPYEGIIPMLKELQSKGYKLAIVSNKFDDAVKGLCKKYFGDYIKVAIGEGKGIEKKPNPMGIYKAIEELEADINNAIYIGDSDVDIETAKNAGLECISVLWGFRNKEFLIKNGGNIFANSPSDIIKIIEKK